MTHFTTNYNDNNYLRSAKKYSSELKKLVKKQAEAEAEAERKPTIVSKNNKAVSSDANIYKMEEYLTEAQLQCQAIEALAIQVERAKPLGARQTQMFSNMRNNLVEKLTRFTTLMYSLIHFFDKHILKQVNIYDASDLSELGSSIHELIDVSINNLLLEPQIILMRRAELEAVLNLPRYIKELKDKFNQAVKTFKSSSIEEIGAGISHGGIADSLHFKLHSKEFINSPYKRYW